MTKISLRAYNQEIENMTDKRQFQEAIAHCQYILEKFPKHIETYRLLGKAYLESGQHSNAADIFQRVLLTVPDDFVSHIGMSIIREDEGNFDAATAHMEKAFEKQPYNPAIQDELRRLYGKRDGMEPPKVRLTQGALARMYIKGNLIEQGIAELRSALAGNPKQIDLLTLLAQIYMKNNKTNEALEIASNILKKYPYNLSANYIMTKLLSDKEHPNVMKISRKRLYALSPYHIHISEHAPTVEQVPDRAITLHQLEWSDSEEHPQFIEEEQPDWATSLGVDIESEEEEELPSWLSDDVSEEAEEQAPKAEAPSEAKTKQEEEDLIPDWMEEAGWGPSDGDVEESELDWDIYEDDEEQDEDELTPANIPDWLQEKEPSPKSEKSTKKEDDAILKGTDWLTELDEEEEFPDLSETSMTADGMQEVPEWLKELGEPEEALHPEKEPIQPQQKEEETEDQDEEILSWLTEPKSKEDQDTVMSWLEEKEDELVPESSDEEVPAWLADLKEEEGAGEPAEPEAEPLPAAEADELPAWLAEMDDEGEEMAEEPEAEPTPAAEADELPAWLAEMEDEEEVEVTEVPEEPAAEPVPAAEADELPAWLAEMDDEGKKWQKNQKNRTYPRRGS